MDSYSLRTACKCSYPQFDYIGLILRALSCCLAYLSRSISTDSACVPEVFTRSLRGDIPWVRCSAPAGEPRNPGLRSK